jgi:hypothetical protein
LLNGWFGTTLDNVSVANGQLPVPNEGGVFG